MLLIEECICHRHFNIYLNMCAVTDCKNKTTLENQKKLNDLLIHFHLLDEETRYIR